MNAGSQQYRVVGVDRNTGDDVEIVIDAVTEQNARVKADLQGIIVTEVADPLTPAPSPASAPNDAGVETIPASDANTQDISDEQRDTDSKRWPWRRVGQWLYNWRNWIALVIVLGAFRLLGNLSWFALYRGGLPVAVTLMMWIDVVVRIGVLVALISAYRSLLNNPAKGGQRIIWAYLAIAAIGLAYIVLGLFALDANSMVARRIQIGGGINLVIGLLLVRLAKPLTYPRFEELARLLGKLATFGVPRSFMKKYNGGRCPVRRYVWRRDEPTGQMPPEKLLRAVATGKVHLPDQIEFASYSDDTEGQHTTQAMNGRSTETVTHARQDQQGR